MVVLLAIIGIGFAIFLGFLIAGCILRLVASCVGVRHITLGNAVLTAFLCSISGSVLTVLALLNAWPEPFSRWIVGVVIQGLIIRRRFSTALSVGIVISLVVALIGFVFGMAVVTLLAPELLSEVGR